MKTILLVMMLVANAAYSQALTGYDEDGYFEIDIGDRVAPGEEINLWQNYENKAYDVESVQYRNGRPARATVYDIQTGEIKVIEIDN